jgi:hypothetical protein
MKNNRSGNYEILTREHFQYIYIYIYWELSVKLGRDYILSKQINIFYIIYIYIYMNVVVSHVYDSTRVMLCSGF